MAFGLSKEKNYFVENLSLLVSSGMNVADAVASISQDIKSHYLKKILVRVMTDLEEGAPLWRALSKEKLLDSRSLALIRIGEESGKLAENLRVIAFQEAKNRIFRSKIRSALLYPALVVSITVVVGVGISWFILPKLGAIFTQLRVPLPWATKSLIGFGVFMGQYGKYVIPGAFVFFIFLFFFLFRREASRSIGQSIFFALPGTRTLVQELELSRFGYLFGTLLSSGLPIVDSLDSIAEASTFLRYKKFYTKMRDLVDEGNSFGRSFEQIKNSRNFVPLPLQQMIMAGEQSGRLSDAFLSIGKNYEEKSEITSKNLSVLLEPVLLVIVWVGVVFVALSVVLPIYSLIGNINQY